MCRSTLRRTLTLLMCSADVLASQSPRASRAFVVILADSVVSSLAAAESQLGVSVRRLGFQSLADELIRNLCEVHTGGPARSTMAVMREVVRSDVGGDSIHIAPTGAYCLRGRGDGGLQRARVIVLSAAVQPTRAANSVERIFMKAVMQLSVADLEGSTAVWMWRPASGWRLQQYENRDMDWIPHAPPEPLVRTPLVRPPVKP
jgi:hypothetical protein